MCHTHLFVFYCTIGVVNLGSQSHFGMMLQMVTWVVTILSFNI